MGHPYSGWPICTAALVSIGLITSGCAGLPSAPGITTMSLSVSAAPLSGPRAPAVVIPVVVPVAAIVGAVAKTTQKLPLEQVVELNRISTVVASQLNHAASFSAALQAEARRRGVTLNVANAGAEIRAVPESLSWDIKGGNTVALRLVTNVTVQRSGDRGSRQVTYRSGSATVDEWVADNGQPIRQSLEEAMAGASELVWNQILGGH